MTAVSSTFTNASNPPDAQVPVLSTKDIENTISSINATQIQSIAQKMIGGLMLRLNIDVQRNAIIPGQTYQDVTGKHHPVIGSIYDPSSRLMQALLPSVTQLITDSFSTPSNFIQNGISIPWSKLLHENTAGILRNQVNQGLNNIVSNFDLNSLSLETTLNINQVRTQEKNELYFDQHAIANGAQIGHDSHTMASFEESAKLHTTFL